MDFPPDKEIYLRSLREVSTDDAKGVAFIDADNQVYNFDKIAKYLTKQLQAKQAVASCDGLLERDGEYYFLEFKNQPQANIDTAQLARKAFQSFQLFRLAIDQESNVDATVSQLTLFVIYADTGEDESFEGVRGKVHQLAKMEEAAPILFGLRKVKNKLYKEIYTISKPEFMSTWYPILFPSPS